MCRRNSTPHKALPLPVRQLSAWSEVCAGAEMCEQLPNLTRRHLIRQFPDTARDSEKRMVVVAPEQAGEV